MAQQCAFFWWALDACLKTGNIFAPGVDFLSIVWYITFCTPKGNVAG
jgi:hypothetical protein